MEITEWQEYKQAMLLGSFLADSFVLGAHWIYNLNKIEANFGSYDSPHGPLPGSWHKDKQLGDFTHYGDQAFVLHEYLRQQNGKYHTTGFRSAWQTMMEDYRGYVDSASTASLSAFRNGEDYGSHSDELGGAARIAPVIYWVSNPTDALAAALDQSCLTHNSKESLLATELFARILLILRDKRQKLVSDLLAQAAEEMRLAGRDMAAYDHYLNQSGPMVGRPASEIAAALGQSCHAKHAIPVVLTILLSTTDYRQALQLDAQIGGDSAARGMIIGAILGAMNGHEALPREWLAVLRKKPFLPEPE